MIESIYKIFYDELNSFFKISDLMLNKEVKNIKECGVLVEIAIRKFLQEVIGDRFKITHGYIIGPDQKLSPQVDLIIVDPFVSHRFKKFEYIADLEIVPVESVVGVFEIKRTLKKEVIKTAASQLLKIKNTVHLPKGDQDQYFVGRKINTSQMKTGIYSNPVFGIIGLALDCEDENDLVIDKDEWFIDVIFSCEGYLKCTAKKINSITPWPNRREEDQVQYKTIRVDDEKLDKDKKVTEASKILMLFVGFLVEYLNQSSGKILNINNYFSYKSNH